jgi:hypothetical protein
MPAAASTMPTVPGLIPDEADIAARPLEGLPGLAPDGTPAVAATMPAVPGPIPEGVPFAVVAEPGLPGDAEDPVDFLLPGVVAAAGPTSGQAPTARDGGAAASQIPDGADFLAGLGGLPEHPPEATFGTEPAMAAAATAAPPAPEGGGWWTRGAPHVPPMVWALPGLPSPDDFAYLLEAEA